MDDISVAGLTQTVAANVGLLVKAASKLGLQLNASKCEIIAYDYSVTRTMKIFDGFRKTLPYELRLLGAPILKGKAIDKSPIVAALERAFSILACYILTMRSVC